MSVEHAEPRRDEALLIDCTSLRGRAPDWAIAAVDSLHGMMEDRLRPFPCTLGGDADKRDKLRFVFVDDPAPATGLDALALGLRQYLQICHTLGRTTSLLAFLNTTGRVTTMDDHERLFWGVLQHLHDVDAHPWPDDYPLDPEDRLWEFCFNGVAMFVVCSTPSHLLRQSRRSECMVIAFQPRFVFTGLEHDSAAGAAARRVIRGRLESFDRVPVYPHLAGYGDPSGREWRQYFLPDSNDQVLARCPLRLHPVPHPHQDEEQGAKS